MRDDMAKRSRGVIGELHMLHKTEIVPRPAHLIPNPKIVPRDRKRRNLVIA